MRLHCEMSYGLESVAKFRPDVKELLDDMMDVVPTSVRILWASYFREDFDFNCISGKRHLATMLMYIPDEKSVEDLNKQCRDLTLQNKNVVTTKTARTRACIDSNVLEHRGIQHQKVTKDVFVRKFRQPEVKMGWRFNSRRHIIDPRWSRMQSRKTWTSTTPETFRRALAAFQWGIHWWKLTPAQRPPIQHGRFSWLCPMLKVVQTPDPNPQRLLSLGGMKWGTIGLVLELFVDPSVNGA
jgi:hypothetical protein